MAIHESTMEMVSYTRSFTESWCLSSRGKARITAGRSEFDRERLRVGMDYRSQETASNMRSRTLEFLHMLRN